MLASECISSLGTTGVAERLDNLHSLWSWALRWAEQILCVWITECPQATLVAGMLTFMTKLNVPLISRPLIIQVQVLTDRHVGHFRGMF